MESEPDDGGGPSAGQIGGTIVVSVFLLVAWIAWGLITAGRPASWPESLPYIGLTALIAAALFKAFEHIINQADD